MTGVRRGGRPSCRLPSWGRRWAGWRLHARSWPAPATALRRPPSTRGAYRAGMVTSLGRVFSCRRRMRIRYCVILVSRCRGAGKGKEGVWSAAAGAEESMGTAGLGVQRRKGKQGRGCSAAPRRCTARSAEAPCIQRFACSPPGRHLAEKKSRRGGPPACSCAPGTWASRPGAHPAAPAPAATQQPTAAAAAVVGVL